MGIYDTITADIAEAFDSDLADAVQAQILVHATTAYDPDTGAVSSIEAQTLTRGVAEPVTDDMVDGEVIQQADTSFLILDAELSATPKVGDDIILDSIRYSLNTVLQDPARVTWQLIGRAV